MPIEETAPTCRRCDRPVADGAHCCNACIEVTGVNLDNIAANADELETTLTRQNRTAPSNGHATESALPLNLRASDVGHRLRNALTTWTRLVAEERGVSIEEAFPDEHALMQGPLCTGRGGWCAAKHPSCRAIVSDRPRPISDKAMATWLKARLGWIAHREWGPEAFDELSRAAVDLDRAVDTPPPMISLGRCLACEAEGRDTELRARQEDDFARCKECPAVYDVRKLKDQLLARADHRTFNAASIARILTALSDRDPEGRLIVRDLKWVTNRVQWKQLMPARLRNGDIATDEAGRTLYPLGAARRLHDDDLQKRILKQAKEAAAA